jgi:uncharacterized protein (DUF2141 family)
MKIKMLFIVYLLSVIGLFSNSIQAQFIIKINNIVDVKGEIHIGIYDDPAVFMGLSDQFIYKRVKVDSSIMLITIDSIPAGRYALSLFQDLNGNAEMDKNFFGIPKEPYGFSENYRPLFRAPEFEETDIVYNGLYLLVEIHLID